MNTKRFLTSWHLWAVILVTGAILFFQRSLDASTIPLLAIILLCPIMMLFMMGDKNHK